MPEPLAILIGLERTEVSEIRSRVRAPLIAVETPPKLQLRGGELYFFHRGLWDLAGPVSKVVFHGIYENDLPTLAALALWGGPCLPGAHGMLDCRPRIPNLARCRRVSRFAALPRGYADAGTTFPADGPTVAKWGEGHCGEGKEVVTGGRECDEPTLFEQFLKGDAVRVQVIGNAAFQVRLAGEDWKKSLHHPAADLTEPDAELVEDTRRMQAHFGLEVCAADYIVTPDGGKHLLELNHIPNVTQFAEMREAYLDLVCGWLDGVS